MQDNIRSIDRGWEKMAALLDKEMPQSHRHRPKILWWVAGAASILVIAGWGLKSSFSPSSSHSTTVPVEKQEQKEQPPMATAQDNRNDGHEERIASAVETQHAHQMHAGGNVIKTHPVARPAVVTGTAGVVLAHGIAQEMHNKDLTEITGASVTEMESVNTITQTHGDFVETDDAIAAQLKEEQGSSLETAARDYVNMRPLASMLPDHLSFAQFDDHAKSITPARHRMPLSLDAAVAMHYNTDRGPLYGMEAGAQVSARLSRRLSLTSGLSYGHYNVDGLSLFGLKSTADGQELANAPNVSVENILDNSLSYDNARQLTETFHYLQAPLRLEYQVTPRISAMAGCRVAMLIAAPARYRLDDQRFSASPSQGSLTSRSYLYDYDILRKWDIAPLAGISLHITPELRIDGTYTYGLTHFVNNPESADRDDFHRSLSIGVRYRLL